MEIHWMANNNSAGQWALYIVADGSALKVTDWYPSQDALAAAVIKTFSGGGGVAPSTEFPRMTLPWGYIEKAPDAQNEINLVSTVPDPPGINIACVRGSEGHTGMGFVRWGIRRDDGVIHGIVLFQGKIDERFREQTGLLLPGELTCHIAQPNLDNDARWKRAFEIRHDGVVFDVPVRAKGGFVLG